MLRITVFICLFACLNASGQNTTIDGYIRTGLDNNLSVTQQHLNLEKAMLNLKIAKGMFYPSLNFQSDYTYAAGGRTFVLPLGDLLNPIHNSLNELTGTNNFNNVPNQEFNLSANDYYINKLNLTLPLVDAEVVLNKKITKEAINQQKAEVLVYKRGLVQDIKIAYYNVGISEKQITIFRSANKLLQDNYKITQSRVTNGKVLKGNALRILSDININEAKLAEAQNNLKTSKAYLNFLINEPLDKEVIIDTTGFRQEEAIIHSEADNTIEREEITSLKSALQQAHLTTLQRKSEFLPKITAYLDVGYQSTYLKINPETNYLLGGFTLKWNLFNGFQTKNKIAFTKKNEAIYEAKIQQSLQQFEYQINAAENDLATARAQLKSSGENLTYLEEHYRETKSRYDQGMVLLVELNDAFTQLINGRLTFELSNTTVLIKKAEAERASASYRF